MSDKKHALLALIGAIRCTRTILPTEYSLVHVTSPLDYQHTIVLRVEGVNINHVIGITLAYFKASEYRALMDASCPDEDQFTAGVVGALMEGVRHLNKDARVWLSAASHITYAGMSGITIHSIYPDDDKIIPQTQLSLFEKGKLITTQYVNDLTVTLPTKD